jgi:hypothetical protein
MWSDKMPSWQNVKLTKCQVDKMPSWQNVKFSNWTLTKIASCINKKFTKLQVDKMSSWQNDLAPKVAQGTEAQGLIYNRRAPGQSFFFFCFHDFQPVRSVRLRFWWRSEFAADGSKNGKCLPEIFVAKNLELCNSWKVGDEIFFLGWNSPQTSYEILTIVIRREIFTAVIHERL